MAAAYRDSLLGEVAQVRVHSLSSCDTQHDTSKHQPPLMAIPDKEIHNQPGVQAAEDVAAMG